MVEGTEVSKLAIFVFQQSRVVTLSIGEPRKKCPKVAVRTHIMLDNNAKYIINEYYDDDEEVWSCGPSIIGCVLQDQVLTFDSL